MTNLNTDPIPQQWIKEYVDTLLEVGKQLEPNGLMQQAVLVRAHNIMDMVEAFRETYDKENNQVSEHRPIS